MVVAVDESLDSIWVAVKTFIYGVFVFLEMDIDVVKILAILMALDTVLGVIKTLILGNKFSFKRLLWGGITKLSILIIPMILALVAKALNFDFTWFVNAVLNLLLLSEAFSSITNVQSIKTKRDIQNTDFISKMLSAIRKGITSMINKILNQIEQGNGED